MITAFIHGLILAFGLILPIGPQNAFILNQGMVQPYFWRALPATLTAALADTLLITIAVLGLSAIVLALPAVRDVLVVLGVLFLLYVGGVTWRSSSSLEKQQQKKRQSIKKQIMFTLSISLLNPHAILDTIGVIGTSSLAYHGDAKFAFAIACILVSWFWFFMLTFIGRWINRIDRHGRINHSLNRISAIIMWLAAIYLTASII